MVAVGAERVGGLASSEVGRILCSVRCHPLGLGVKGWDVCLRAIYGL